MYKHRQRILEVLVAILSRHIENLHDVSKITLKYSSIFRRRILYIFDASWKYPTIIQCHSGRVKKVFIHFGRVQNE